MIRCKKTAVWARLAGELKRSSYSPEPAPGECDLRIIGKQQQAMGDGGAYAGIEPVVGGPKTRDLGRNLQLENRNSSLPSRNHHPDRFGFDPDLHRR
jgi:hypothetical protein